MQKLHGLDVQRELVLYLSVSCLLSIVIKLNCLSFHDEKMFSPSKNPTLVPEIYDHDVMLNYSTFQFSYF